MVLLGLVAQLGAHHIRIVGVGSSNLLKSTKKKHHLSVVLLFYQVVKDAPAQSQPVACPGTAFCELLGLALPNPIRFPTQ